MLRLSQHRRECHRVGQDGPSRASQMRRCHLLASTGVLGPGVTSMGTAGTFLCITCQLLQEQQPLGEAHVGANGS